MRYTASDWIPVNFPEDQQEFIRKVGVSRFRVKEASGMSERQLREKFQSGAQGAAQSYAAECALAMALGSKPHTDASKRGSNGRHVKVTKNGRDLWLNACWGSDPTWDLKYSPNRIPEADIFALTTGQMDETMWVIGGMSRKAFLSSAKAKDYGHGERLAVEQTGLTPAGEIARYLGAGDVVDRLRKEHREKRLRHQEKQGSLFGETNAHRDPA